jgi:hypothetical protein
LATNTNTNTTGEQNGNTARAGTGAKVLAVRRFLTAIAGVLLQRRREPIGCLVAACHQQSLVCAFARESPAYSLAVAAPAAIPLVWLEEASHETKLHSIRTRRHDPLVNVSTTVTTPPQIRSHQFASNLRPEQYIVVFV